jgi:hypothetical protein
MADDAWAAAGADDDALLALAIRESEALAKQQQLEEEQLAWALRDSLELEPPSGALPVVLSSQESDAADAARTAAVARSGHPLPPQDVVPRTVRERAARSAASATRSRSYGSGVCDAESGIRPHTDNPARQRRRRMQAEAAQVGAGARAACGVTTQGSAVPGTGGHDQRPDVSAVCAASLIHTSSGVKSPKWLPPARAPRPVVTAILTDQERPSWSLPDVQPPALFTCSSRDAPPVLVWIRPGDLRLADNPSLYEAWQTGAPVVPVYVEPPESELGGWPVRCRGGAGISGACSEKWWRWGWDA